MSGEPYIVNGQIFRGSKRGLRSHYRLYLSWKRVCLVCLVLAVLIVTNPANRDELLQTRSRNNSGSGKILQYYARRVTNYLLFSMEERFESVVISALQQSWSCSFNDANVGHICNIIADQFCHQKPLIWDETDRPYTAHRILCDLLIWSALVSYCRPRAPKGKLFGIRYLDGLASVFDRPRIVQDLVYANCAVYPALVEMNRIIPRLHSRSMISTGDNTLDFVIGVLLLVLLVGGGSNMLASRISGHPVYGFSPVSAASLAYYQRISLVRRPIVFHILNQPVTGAGAYWSSVAFLVVQNRNWFPFMVAWLSAGWGGSVLAKYHLENMTVFGDIFKFFGLV